MTQQCLRKQICLFGINSDLKGWVHCFSMQCLLLNLEKKFGANLSFLRKTHTLILKNNVTEPKARLLQLPIKSC